MARRRDFTSKREPIEFTIDDDVFRAPASIPAAVLLDLMGMQEQLGDLTKLDPEKGLQLLVDIFNLLLTPASATRFKERLTSREEPLDLQEQVIPIIEWLVEEYTARPTKPSLNSPAGSATNGGASTAGAPLTESTPSISPQTASAT